MYSTKVKDGEEAKFYKITPFRNCSIWKSSKTFAVFLQGYRAALTSPKLPGKLKPEPSCGVQNGTCSTCWYLNTLLGLLGWSRADLDLPH